MNVSMPHTDSLIWSLFWIRNDSDLAQPVQEQLGFVDGQPTQYTAELVRHATRLDVGEHYGRPLYGMFLRFEAMGCDCPNIVDDYTGFRHWLHFLPDTCPSPRTLFKAYYRLARADSHHCKEVLAHLRQIKGFTPRGERMMLLAEQCYSGRYLRSWSEQQMKLAHWAGRHEKLQSGPVYLFHRATDCDQMETSTKHEFASQWHAEAFIDDCLANREGQESFAYMTKAEYDGFTDCWRDIKAEQMGY